MAYLEMTRIISKRLNFVFFKMTKPHRKDLHEEKPGRSKIKTFESFERIILLLLYTFFEKKNLQ